jgi:hypothetical protein
MRICQHCERETSLSSVLCERCLRGPGSSGEWLVKRTYSVQGWGIVVVILTGLATLYLGAINVLTPMIAHAMAADPSTRQDAYTLADLELGAGNTNTLFVLVPLMVWMWRATKNTEAFPQPDGGLKAAWAIWGWIVPVLNLSYPLRMMRQLAREEREGDGWGTIARLWWLAFASSTAITLGEAFGLIGGSRPDNLSAPAEQHLAFFTSRSITGVITGVLILIAGVTLSALVLAIGKAQTERINARTARVAGAAAMATPAAAVPAPQPAVAGV